MKSNEASNPASDVEVDKLASRLGAIEPQLDDLARARIAATLKRRVEQGPPAEMTRSASAGAKRTAAITLALAAIAAAAVYLIAPSRPSAPRATMLSSDSATHVRTPVQEQASEPGSLDAEEKQLAEGTSLRAAPDSEFSVEPGKAGSLVRLASGSVSVRANQAPSPTSIVVADVSVVIVNAVISASVSKQELVVHLSEGDFVIRRKGREDERISALGTTRISLQATPRQATARMVPQETPQTPRETSKPSANALYRRAENLMSSGDAAGGVRTLREFLSAYPKDPRASDAQLDIARIAYRTRDLETARRHLEPLSQQARKSALSQAAHYLLCRIHIEEAAAEREFCVESFRSAYPQSHHDQELLAVQIGWAYQAGGCEQALPLLAKLEHRHGAGAIAGKLAELRSSCRRRESE